MLSGDDKRAKKKKKASRKLRQKTILVQLSPRRVMIRGIRSVSAAEPGAVTRVTRVTSHLDHAH